MKFYNRTKAAGFSLIELLLVIGFIAGALVLAFVTYPKVQATNRANVEAQHITILSGGIKNLYATAQNFTTLTNKVLLQSKIVPDDLQTTDTDITNIWGGTIVAASDVNQPLYYTLTYTGVPRAECTKLGTSVAVNFLRLHVNTVLMFDRTATTGAGNIALDPATVATNCKDGLTNIIMFTGN